MTTLLDCGNVSVPTAENFQTVKIATIVLDVVVSLVYIVTVALSIFLEIHKRFLSRLLLYLTVVILFFTIFDAIKMAAYQESGYGHYLQLHEASCTATAFMTQFLFLLIQFILCVMTFHMFSLSVYQRNMHTRRCEITAIAVGLAVVLLFSIIPFIPFEGSTAYGWYKGYTCWIKTINITSCETFTPGRVEQWVVGFIWVVIGFIYMSISLILSILALCRQFSMQGDQRPLFMQIQHRQALKEAVALIVYLIIVLLYIILSIVLYLITEYGGDSQAGIVKYAVIVNPIIILLIPTTLFLHPKCLRCSELRIAAKRWKRRLRLDVNTDSETNFIVPNEPEFSEVNRLVIRGTSEYRGMPNYATLETVGNIH